MWICHRMRTRMTWEIFLDASNFPEVIRSDNSTPTQLPFVNCCAKASRASLMLLSFCALAKFIPHYQSLHSRARFPPSRPSKSSWCSGVYETRTHGGEVQEEPRQLLPNTFAALPHTEVSSGRSSRLCRMTITQSECSGNVGPPTSRWSFTTLRPTQQHGFQHR